MRPARAPIEDLRLAIDCLPLRTREAMLAGIRSHEVMLGIDLGKEPIMIKNPRFF